MLANDTLAITTAQPVMLHIPLDLVKPNPEQPREHFDEVALQELADSIKEHGVITPIVVNAADGVYILQAGERRTRAARLAGLESIPAMVHYGAEARDAQGMLERAIIENVQRVDMSPMEEARAYGRLRDQFHQKAAAISRRIGKNSVIISQRLMLLELEPTIQSFIEQGLLPHDAQAVRAILSLPPGETRVKLCAVLATRKPTIKTVVESCGRFLLKVKEHEHAKRGAGPLEIPAVDLAERREGLKLPEWDIMAQLGTLPPWQTLRMAAQSTCDACGIRPVASKENCRDCPAVECIRRMIQATHVANPNVKAVQKAAAKKAGKHGRSRA